MYKLAIIVVSANERHAHCLQACLPSVFEHAGECTLDVVVVDNSPTKGAAELVEDKFPHVRVIQCENHGFGHANNRALMATDARYVLFLNPDTEILGGTFAGLIDALDARPTVGLVGVRQLTGDGELYPTIRRFPNALRAFGQGVLSERFPLRPAWLFERQLNRDVYDREVDCDWTSGSFMLARREALESSGYMDERFFIYSEEPDLCLRLKRAGWEVRHMPHMTIVHHAEKAGVRPRMAAQDAYARRQYALKHFSAPHRVLYEVALSLGLVRRVLFPAADSSGQEQRAAARAALRVLARIDGPPFGEPPRQAIRPGSRER